MRPWTEEEDQLLRVMYSKRGVSLQGIRDALHRSGPTVYRRIAELALSRPDGRQPAGRQTQSCRVRKVSKTFPRSARLIAAVAMLRRRGFAPVFAERVSDDSTSETGNWIVGRLVLTPDEVVGLAEGHVSLRSVAARQTTAPTL